MQIATGQVDSAVTAREDIGRAVAAKIRDLKTAKELSKVVEEVLPEVEKFLETPQERRLRRLRAGLIMQAIGLGACAFFVIFSLKDSEMLFMSGLGIVVFLIGLATFLNGRYLSVPSTATNVNEDRMRLRDTLDRPRLDTGRLLQESDVYLAPPPSVVEHTTRELRDVAAVPRSRTTAE